ncbi:MAG TPA: YcxB family protein [Candidatus Dorea gallistercoris]|uniref:YcxB family protein n=1 Tax=Candidatus Dorea gallistercoris TaxID=2838542 RepID=A0A9D1UFA4_9FIRM|nr:YcxB family protein [Candidatus Dorea gallistercoris]
MSVKVEVRMDAGSMADFMVYHIFSGKAGIMALALGGLNIGFAVVFAMRENFGLTGLFLAFAALVLAGFPYIIRRKVVKQVEASERLRAPVTYTFDEEGIETVREDDSGKASWEQFQKAVSRKRIIILYDAHRHAIVLPVDQLGEDYRPVVDMIRTHMPARAMKIRPVKMEEKEGVSDDQGDKQ